MEFAGNPRGRSNSLDPFLYLTTLSVSAPSAWFYHPDRVGAHERSAVNFSGDGYFN